MKFDLIKLLISKQQHSFSLSRFIIDVFVFFYVWSERFFSHPPVFLGAVYVCVRVYVFMCVFYTHQHG